MSEYQPSDTTLGGLRENGYIVIGPHLYNIRAFGRTGKLLQVEMLVSSSPNLKINLREQ